MNQIYLDTARLLTRIAPLVLVDDTFALKGGTAINLFVRDMPRLSVDLDLGMTTEPVELEAPLAAGERMVRELQQGLTAEERRFLLSLVAAKPEWSLLGVPHLEHLPGLQWKLHNLKKLKESNAIKFAKQSEALARQLDS